MIVKFIESSGVEKPKRCANLRDNRDCGVVVKYDSASVSNPVGVRLSLRITRPRIYLFIY